MTNENEVNQQQHSEKKSPGIFRILWRFFLFIFSLSLVAFISAILLGYYYQNEVKGYIITQLNKQLNTEIIVDGKDIDFTIIKSFPLASLNFGNAKALDAIKSAEKDTLFSAQNISLQFNIVDIFHKNYHIKKIKIDDANLKIKIDKNGEDNYHFWKPSADSANTSFSFALEEIKLNNVEISFKNYETKQNINFIINKSKLSGNFSNEKHTLETQSDLFVNRIKIKGISYLNKKNISANLKLEVDNNIQSYKIHKGEIKIENLVFEIFGNVINESKVENELIVNLGIRGQDMDIKSVLSIIPNNYKDRINDYESEGEFYFDATIKGAISGNNTPSISAEFGIKNADITQIKDNITLHNVNLKGRYANENKVRNKTSLLELIPFSASINNGSIAGELSILNLNEPFIDAKIKANFSLAELQKFIKIDTIESISGQLKMDAIFKGKWKNINSNSFQELTNNGNMTITDMNVRIKNNSLDFKNINGDFNLDNNDLIVNSLTGNVSNSDFDLKGIFKNTMGFILKENQDITVEATLLSKNINLNELLANKEENNISKSTYKLKFSEHIDVNLQSHIDHIAFRKFEAEDIRGTLILKDKKMMADPIRFTSMSGNISISGFVDGSDSSKFLVTCVSDVNQINVSNLFTAFENFTQSTITDQNIKGLITAKIQFSSVLNPELTMDMSKLYANIDMTIENGELNNVSSMKSLSRFIELKELNDIHFATLKNSFEIKDQVVSFPKMEIKSTAMNIMLSGTHTFKNEINYKIKLSLNELLSKKIRKPKKESSTNESYMDMELADDGLGRRNIFLTMTGTVDKPVIKYDTKGAVQSIKQDIKEEKHSLKSILKEEFGLFKKDTALNIKSKKEEQKFIIKWEEEDKKEERKELKMPKKKEEDDF